MDPRLKDAACLGDVEFLKKAFTSQPIEYFVSHYQPENKDYRGATGNIFHLSAKKGREEFFKEAMGLLPTHIKLQLLCEKDKYLDNPLHVLAWYNSDRINFGMVKIMLDFYKSYSGPPPLKDDQKPWLAINLKNLTALHMAFARKQHFRIINEKIAIELFSMDNMDQPWAFVDEYKISPLYYAVEAGSITVAEKIVKSFPDSCSVAGPDGSTPLHVAPNSKSETVLRFLLDKHPDMMESVDDKTGFNVLHKWAEIGEVWPLNVIFDGDFPAVRTKVLNDLINQTTENENRDSPLHTAIRNDNMEFVKVLLQSTYQQDQVIPKDIIHNDDETLTLDDYSTLKVQNKEGFTPLMLALSFKHDEFALYFLSLDSSQLYINTQDGISLFLHAIAQGHGEVAEKILTTIQEFPFSMLCDRKDGCTVIHYLPRIEEKIGRKVLEKFWWMMNLANDSGKTPLNFAKEENAQWLVNLLEKPSLIERQPFDWIATCEKGESSAIFAFIDTCPDLQKFCRDDKNDTPLHHINLQTYQDYLRLLKIPAVAELKNTTDHEGATPLHQAIRRENKLLAKALLKDREVARDLRDNHGATAMDLLSDICNKNRDWASMCKEIKVNPHLKTTYIQSDTDLGQMRSTLSVVAALLATITFAAGFTLPGGLDEQSGAANLAKNAAFLVFLLSDAYAMCTSMFVLFCLIWSMTATPDMSYILIDRSVWILTQALYGTMVAFMTGVYVVISHSSLWAAIVIFVMCSLIGVAASKTILYEIVKKLIPKAELDQRDPAHIHEEGTKSVDEENQDLENQELFVEEGPRTDPIHRSRSYSKAKKMNSTQDEEKNVRRLLIALKRITRLPLKIKKKKINEK